MFSSFERTVAGRYLRARRGERFVSVIAGFSLVGIALGVATLIIVMSVMSGFKVDLLSRILGFNGHLGVYGVGGTTRRTSIRWRTRIRAVPGVSRLSPVVDGQVLLTDTGTTPPAARCAASARQDLRGAAVGQRAHPRRLAGRISPATTRSRSASGWRGGSAWASAGSSRWSRRRGRRPRSAPCRACAPTAWRRSSRSA